MVWMVIAAAWAEEPSRACDGGDLDGCRAACPAGVVRACIKLGDRAEVVEERVVAYSAACDLGSDVGCRAVGDLHTTGALGRPDGVAAGEWYRRACDLGDATACTATALWVARGDGDIGMTAESLLERACEAHDLRACTLLGERLLFGAGDAPRDEAAALAWFGRACTPPGWDPEACRRLGLAELAGKDLPADPVAGAEHLSRACDRADRLACFALARERSREEDWDGVRRLAGRACELGERPACRLARKAEDQGG